MKSIPYGRQNITEEDIEAVVAVLKSDYLTQGPAIPEFEEMFSEYIGAKYSVAVSNGTAALHLCALATDLKPNEKVITTPITFAASANCVSYCSGKIIFADIDPSSYLINLNIVEDLLKKDYRKEIKGVIPVDFAGYPISASDYRFLADKYGIWIIEDACHAPGAFIKNANGELETCGNGVFSDMTVFSFHPVKHITTGEGGMITTNNKTLYNKLVLLRSHGITKDIDLLTENHGGWYYEMQELGYNYRLTDIQAALGLSQLKRADSGIKRRNEIAARYDEAFKGTSIEIPKVEKNVYHAYHLYVIQVEKRLELYNFLKSKNIFPQIHYIPVHLLPYYRQKGWNYGDFPVAENYYSRCLSLPMFPSLTNEEQDYVIFQIIEFLKNNE
jgi:UDP-4-amino-4,6-dideoxy-N-acetyl-beta-L-altrosamine transaminase